MSSNTKAGLSITMLYTLAMAALPACGQKAQALPGAGALQAPTEVVPSRNGAWLGHAFVTTKSVVATVPAMCAFMRDHKVNYLFVNLGLHDGDGSFSHGTAAVPQVKEFLSAINDWEKSANHRFCLLGWLNGSTDEASTRYLDLSSKSVRAAMLKESKRFSDPEVEGSYVAGVGRMFDGIQYDLEPSGANQKQFTNIITFMRELRSTLSTGKMTSFTPHKWGESGRYKWGVELFYRMSSETDLLCVMTYNSSSTDEAAYKDWIKEQTVTVLKAVSGRLWKNDKKHPQPARPAKVLLGVPGYPANQWHDPAVETMGAAVAGVRAGIRELQAAQDLSLTYLEGVAIYLYTDGSGKDGYSSRSNWATFSEE
ncbi:MAG TPA: glycosyl hydrolase family 18 protein [Abditibacteriaceae bacterium]|jgi:hypothetical protein